MKRERCPFCGSIPRIVSSEDTSMRTFYWVECKCGARMISPNAGFIRSEDEAIRAWNRRVTPRATIQKTVQVVRLPELRAMLKDMAGNPPLAGATRTGEGEDR